MATLAELNVNRERESSLKHHVRSNVKHKTKKNAPGQTAAQSKNLSKEFFFFLRASSRKADSSFSYLLNY